MPWKCFIATATEWRCRSLRRYSGVECPKTPIKIHDAEVIIDPEVHMSAVDETNYTDDSIDPDVRRDARWPDRCACEYRFHPEDHWLVRVETLFRVPDGRLFRLRDAPVGAMWDAHWMGERYRGPDGKAWCLRLPPGTNADDWLVYGPSRDGVKWKITGKAPAFTASPSIGTRSFHGLLKNGVISEDLDGRLYPELPRTA